MMKFNERHGEEQVFPVRERTRLHLMGAPSKSENHATFADRRLHVASTAGLRPRKDVMKY